MSERIIRDPWKVVDYASQRGASVAENPVEVLNHLPVIDCGLGDSPFGPPPELNVVIENAVASGALIYAIKRYPPDKFCEGPTDLIRERFGLSKDPVIVFHGEGSYGLLAKTILELPDITPESELGMLGIGPQFPNVAALTEKHGVKPEGGYKFPYESVKPELDLTLDRKIQYLIEHRRNGNGNRFLYVDNPNNPTGDFASLDSIRSLVEFAQANHDLVIVDEAYGDATDDRESAISLTEYYPNLIVVRGTAKVTGMAGIRLGYAIMSRPVGETFQSLQLVFGVNGPTQLIANGVMKPDVLKPHLSTVRNNIVTLKSEMVEGLTETGVWIAPTHPAVPIMLAKGPDANFFRELKRYQVVTERGTDFTSTYPLDDSFVRMRIPGTREEVEEVLRRVKLALQ